MEYLKNFSKFIKESKLDNQIDIEEDDTLKNIKNTPSDVWEDEINFNNESIEELENSVDDDFDDEIEIPIDKKMLHKPVEEIREKVSSEMKDYEIKNVFDEEEDEEL